MSTVGCMPPLQIATMTGPSLPYLRLMQHDKKITPDFWFGSRTQQKFAQKMCTPICWNSNETNGFKNILK